MGVPEMMEVTQEMTRLYAERTLNRVFFMFLDVLFPLAVMASGLAVALRGAIDRRFPTRLALLGVAAFYLAYVLVEFAVYLPFEWWREFLLEQRYKLTTLTAWGWIKRQLGNLAYAVGFMTPLVVLGYWLFRRWPRRWWLAFAAVYAAYSLAIAVVAPTWISPLFDEYVALEDQALESRIRSMAAEAGVPQVEIAVERTSARSFEENATVSGFFSVPRIVFTDNLLAALPPDDVLSIVAHELGHYRLRHAWTNFAVDTLLALLTLAFVAWAAPRLLARYGPRWGVARLQDHASLPLLLALVASASFVTTPLANLYSREKERAADRFALARAQSPEACVASYGRIHGGSLEPPNPPRWSYMMFHTHPSLAERIEQCRDAGRGAPKMGRPRGG